jgi:hypothetical protein
VQVFASLPQLNLILFMRISFMCLAGSTSEEAHPSMTFNRTARGVRYCQEHQCRSLHPGGMVGGVVAFRHSSCTASESLVARYAS